MIILHKPILLSSWYLLLPTNSSQKTWTITKTQHKLDKVKVYLYGYH